MRKVPIEYENPLDNYLYDIADKISPYAYNLNMTPKVARKIAP